MEQERTYKWIQDRIRDLHSGTLSESDRARLFELSKDDPFLKDALEGYQSSPGHDHVARLQTISYRIQSKTFAKRRKLFPSRQQWFMQAVAASLLLILVTWAVIYYVGKENNSVLVSSENGVVPSDSVLENTDVKQDVEADLAYEEQPATELLQEEPGLRANARSKYEAASKESKDIYTAPSSSGGNPGTIAAAEEPPPPTLDAIESKDISLKSTTVEIDEVVTETAVLQTDSDDRAREMDAATTANAMSPAMLEQRVTGQIMNSFGQPLTGAFISIPNSNLITTSDTYGQFELFIPGVQTPVEISSTGYQDTVMQLRKGQENVVVVLSPMDSPNPPYAVYQKTEKNRSNVTTGFRNNSMMFQDYISANSRLPVQTQYTSSSHPVTLQFNVNAEGRPEKVTTIKSNVPKKYHTEAIRLVENGPLWTCEKFPCRKEYTIYFE